MSSAELRQADDDAFERFGIEPEQLMEIAGWQVARFVDRFVDGVGRKRIVVVAGSGNNGGDALCAARFLHQRGASVVASIVPPRGRNGLAAKHGVTVRELGIDVRIAPQGVDGSADVIVDGLFGTGIRPPLRDPAPQIIEAINKAGPPVIAVDVPSGMDADDATGADQAVRATATLTLAAPKAGLGLTPRAGRIFLADIGMPASLFSTGRDALIAIYRMGDLVELRRP